MIVTDARGWRSFKSICDCEYSIVTGELLNVCVDHEPYSFTAVNAFDLWIRMHMSIVAEAMSREVAA